MAGQVNAPQLMTPMGYDQSTKLWLPLLTSPVQTNPADNEEYAVLAVENDIQTWIRNGQGFIASTGRLSSATNTNVIMGMGIFNNSTAKNILIYSLKFALSSTSNVCQLNMTTADPAMGSPVTVKNLSNAATSSLATVSMPANSLAASVAVIGTLVDFTLALNNTIIEFLNNGAVIVLPAGAANGVAMYLTMPAATNGYTATMRWVEY